MQHDSLSPHTEEGGGGATFRVGMKVACIKNYPRRPESGWGHEVMPVKGEVYTIRELVPPKDSIQRPVCLLLEEITNAPDDYVDGIGEFCFIASCFRPVKTTSIDVFLKMLAPEDANA